MSDTSYAYRKVKVGSTVKLRERIETRGGLILDAGVLMRVEGKRGGFALETVNNEPCKSCGVGQRHRVTGVPLWKVEVVELAK